MHLLLLYGRKWETGVGDVDLRLRPWITAGRVLSIDLSLRSWAPAWCVDCKDLSSSLALIV